MTDTYADGIPSFPTQPEPFLKPLHQRIEAMVAGARIILKLDPEPYADKDPRKIHPVAQARRDAFHFDWSFLYPDGTGQEMKSELEAFLATLRKHPSVDSHFAREERGVLIRFEVSNQILWNDKRVWIGNGVLTQGRFEDMRGIHIRAWGSLSILTQVVHAGFGSPSGAC